MKFEEKLMKSLKLMDSIIKYVDSNNCQKTALKYSFQIRANLILFLKKSFALQL